MCTSYLFQSDFVETRPVCCVTMLELLILEGIRRVLDVCSRDRGIRTTRSVVISSVKPAEVSVISSSSFPV